MARRISSSLPDAHGPTAAPFGVMNCVGAAGFLPRHGLRPGAQSAPFAKTLRGAAHEDPFAAGGTMMRRVPARLHSERTRPHRQPGTQQPGTQQPGTHRHSQQPVCAARQRQREAADATRPDSFRCAVSELFPASLPLALTQTGPASGLRAPPGRPRPYANACFLGPPAPQTNPGL